jgi:hypothetical protein
MSDVPPMGEADIKFLRWAEHFGPGDMIAHSVDGDFVPIALMRYEEEVLRMRIYQQKQQRKDEGVERREDVHHPSPPPPMHRVAIYRIKYKSPGTGGACSKQAQQNAAKRQRTLSQCKSTGSVVASQKTDAGAQVCENPSASRKREFEYVDVAALYAGMREVFCRLFDRTVPRNPLHKYHYMRILAALVSMSGTDFSRGFPQVSVFFSQRFHACRPRSSCSMQNV